MIAPESGSRGLVSLAGWRLGAAVALVALVYATAAKLGLSLAVVAPQVSPVWAPTGIALAAVLLLGEGAALGVWVGAFAANLMASTDVAASGAVVGSVFIAAGNTLEALVGAWLLKRARFGVAMESVRDVALLAVLGAGVSTVVSATCGVVTLVVRGPMELAQAPSAWVTWWLGDAMGDLVFAPLLLTWAARCGTGARARWGEALAMYAMAVATGWAVLVVLGRTAPELHFLAAWPLVWSALRLGQADTAAAVAGLSVLAAWGAWQAPPANGRSLNATLLMLQAFVGLASVSALVLGAATAERRRAQATLLESEIHLRLALDAARMGTWEWDPAAGRAAWGPIMAELHGIESLGSRGQPEELLARVHPEDRARVRAMLRGEMNGGEGKPVEYRLDPAAGTGRWLEGRGRVLRGADGEAVVVVGVCADVTARKKAEVELALRAAALARSNADLEDFACIAGHDLKEPLRGINTYVSFLMEDDGGALSESARDKIEAVRGLSARMEELISALLEYSRLGRAELAVVEADLGEVVKEALGLLAGRLAEEPVEVVVNPLPTVRCDRVRVREVFVNLVSNALKYNDKARKRVEIGVGPAPVGRAETGLVLYVRDNGIGIPARQMSQLFRMFRRLHPRSRYGGGAGAGLAIVKGIVERHGGRVWCRSVPGEGSTFYFTLEGAPAGAEGDEAGGAAGGADAGVAGAALL